MRTNSQNEYIYDIIAARIVESDTYHYIYEHKTKSIVIWEKKCQI